MLTTDVKQKKKNRAIMVEAVSFHRSTSKNLKYRCKTSMYFAFNLGWYFNQKKM